jgi:hypothetical protein
LNAEIVNLFQKFLHAIFKNLISGCTFGIFGLLLPLVLFAVLVVANASVPAMRKHIGPGADVLHFLLVRICEIVLLF